MSSVILTQEVLCEIRKYNSARQEIEVRFKGLPHIHTTLVKSLLSRANPETGLVENISYSELAMMLGVDPAPGRKNAGIPQKQTIRSYLRTIAEQCNDDFKLISQGQKLQCQFSNLPKIYAHFLAQKKEYTDLPCTLEIYQSIENIEEKGNFEELFDREYVTEVAIEEMAIKNINNLNINNKQTITGPRSSERKMISDDFYPDVKTIQLALGRGFSKVTNPVEIKKFIQHNQAKGSLWADYNPVFIRWLANDFNPQQKTANTNRFLGGYFNERRSSSNHTSKPTMQDLYFENRNATSPGGSRPYPGEVIIEGECCLAVDSAWGDIRQSVYC